MGKNIGQSFYSLFAWTLFVPTVLSALLASRLHMLITKGHEEAAFYRTAGLIGAAWGRLVGIRFRRDPDFSKRFSSLQSYVFVSNHTSFLDLIAITYGLPTSFRTLSKIENRHIPIFGATIAPGIITVDRSSPESRKKSMEKMAQLVKRGVSVLVFPEGTRNRNYDQPLLPEFYDGAFRIAIQHHIPIVPAVITGARSSMDTKGFLFRPGEVQIHFLPAFSTKDLTVEDIPQLKAEVYAAMRKKILEADPFWKKGGE